MEKEKVACSSILAWKIPLTEEPDGLTQQLKDSTIHSSVLGTFGLLTSLSNILPILDGGALRNYRSFSQISILICLEKCFSRLGINFLHSLLLNFTSIKQHLPQSTKSVQIGGITIQPQEMPVSETVSFCLALWEVYSLFFLLPQPHLHIRLRFLRKVSCWNFFFPEG